MFEFFRIYKIGNINIIANFVFLYICYFLLYLHHMILVNMKLDINGDTRITFQDCKLHLTCLFLMAHPEQSWQFLAFLYCGGSVKTSAVIADDSLYLM